MAADDLVMQGAKALVDMILTGFDQNNLLRTIDLWKQFIDIVVKTDHHIDCLAQDCSNSIAKALELQQSCT